MKPHQLFTIILIISIFSADWARSQTLRNDTITIVATRNFYNRAKSVLAYLDQQIPFQVVFEEISSSKEINLKLRNGEADLALMNAYGYAYAKAELGDQIRTLLIPGDQDGNPLTYRSCLLTSASSKIKSLEELAAKSNEVRFAFAYASSTSGHAFPRLKLAEEGIKYPEDIFKDVDFLGSHHEVIKALKDNKIQAGGLSYATLEKEIRKGNYLAEDFHLLWKSEGLPHGLFVMQSALPAIKLKIIKEVLSTFSEKAPPAVIQQVMDDWSITGFHKFVPADESLFDPIVAATKKVGDVINFLNHYEEKLDEQEFLIRQAEIRLDTLNEEIASKELRISKQLVLIENQKLFLLVVTIFAILSAFAAVIVVRLNILRKKAIQKLNEKNIQISNQKELIEQSNSDLQQKQEEILTQNEELYQQNEEITLQKNFIQKANKKLQERDHMISSSIRAASVIQRAILPHERKLSRLLQHYFIVNKPRDVVSGDFYWVNQVEDKVVLVVGDCTGHGVPGALMTMIASAFFDKTIRVYQHTKPSTI